MGWTSPAETFPPAQAPRWPRVYRAGRRQRILLGGVGAVLGLGALALAVWIALDVKETPGLRLAMIGSALVFVVLGAALLAAVLRGRVELWEDRIAFRELHRTRKLRKDEIVGWRLIPLQHGLRQLVLELRPPRKKLSVGWLVETDEVFQEWMASIPNLDAVEQARAEAELLRAPELGQTEPERRQALRRARVVARIAAVVGVAAAAWGWLLPRPYPAAIAVLTAIPVLAGILLLTGRGRYSLDGERNEPRPNLVGPLMLPGLVLMLRGVLDLRTLQWQQQLAWTAAASGVAALILSRGDLRLRRRAVAVPLLVLAAAPWAWGTIVFSNALLDRAPAELHRVAVLEKHLSGGKHTSYNLRLAPWGPFAEPEEVDVGSALYRETEVGEEVCPRLGPGALGLRWFVVGRCPPR